MKKMAALLNILLILSLFFACGTPPETTPEDSDNTTEDASALGASNPTEDTTTTQVDPITDEEINKAKNAIARAEEVDAASYDPDNLNAAKKDLSLAEVAKDADPTQARKYLATSIEKADAAFETSKNALKEKYLMVLHQNDEKLLEISADLYEPDSYNNIKSTIEGIKENFEGDDFITAKNHADFIIVQMLNLHKSLNEKIIWVRVLREDVEKHLETAEEKNSYLWAEKEMDNINKLYYDGVEALAKYDLNGAEENFGSAKELSLSLLNADTNLQYSDETADLKKKVLDLLKEASQLTVITEDGDVIEPDPIDIDDFIKKIQEEQEAEEGSEAEDNEEGPIEDGGGNTSFLNLDSKVLVLGDVEGENLLEQAKELIRLGIVEENKGNYEFAQDYFSQAQGYLIAYKAQAVTNVYTVRLIPDRRDCLWRIAEYPYIFNNPYMWPLIWRRNRKTIQNPNLIYPNQKLVIPPKPEEEDDE